MQLEVVYACDSHYRAVHEAGPTALCQRIQLSERLIAVGYASACCCTELQWPKGKNKEIAVGRNINKPLFCNL